MGSKTNIQTVLILDEAEQHAPPSSSVLQIEVIPRGGSLTHDILSLAIGKYEDRVREKETVFTEEASICVRLDVVLEQIALMKKVN